MIIQGIIELRYNIRSAWFLDIRISTCFDLKFLRRINFECAFNFFDYVEIKLVFSARNKDQKLVGHFLKIRYFMGY